jgi:hypothetical protein
MPTLIVREDITRWLRVFQNLQTIHHTLQSMATTRSLPRVTYRSLCQHRYSPSGCLKGASKPLFQHRLLVSSADTTATSMSSANGATVMDAIKHDHAELKEYYNNILNAKDDDSMTRWQNQFVWELARHSIGEELVVYPAMEKHMGPEGKGMADKDRTEHNKVSNAPEHIGSAYLT